MGKQMIITVPSWMFEEGDHCTLERVGEAASRFLKGEGKVLIFPEDFSYTVNDIEADISEVVITYDKGERL